MTTVDTLELEAKVKGMYREVAEHPQGDFHFELGAEVAPRAGYDQDRIAALPPEAVESFAGVGYFFDLAALESGETVVDLGSGSGMDALYAAGLVGSTGQVIGVDFTVEQLTEAIVCNTDLWASCIGGAAQQQVYLQAIESAGFSVVTIRVNDYEFISDRARSASTTYGVKSISVLATLLG